MLLLGSRTPALALLAPLVLAGTLAGCRSSTESGVSAVNQLVREGREDSQARNPELSRNPCLRHKLINAVANDTRH